MIERRSGMDRRRPPQIVTRARLAGLFCILISLTQGAIALAADEQIHGLLESVSSGLLFFGGAVLVLVRDPRCSPKLKRLDNILMAALMRRLGVTRADIPDDSEHGGA